jgi:hypothetical protein
MIQEIDNNMARLGLVTLELMLAELRRPVFAGDVPVKMDLEKAQYETVRGGEQYVDDYMGGAGPDDEEDCGCGGDGDGCGDGGCGGGCGHEMMTMTMEAGPADFEFYGPLGADPVGDRDKTRDRSPRPDRKRLPWSFAPVARIAS